MSYNKGESKNKSIRGVLKGRKKKRKIRL